MKVPYIFVADDVFPLTNNIMKPFPGIQKKKAKKYSQEWSVW